MFCRSLFVLFLLANVLSVRRFIASDYPFGTFKLFLLEMETLFKKKRLYVFYVDTKHNVFLLKSTGSAILFVSLIIMICYGAVLCTLRENIVKVCNVLESSILIFQQTIHETNSKKKDSQN